MCSEQSQDETEYLLASPANAERLIAAIEELEGRSITRGELDR